MTENTNRGCSQRDSAEHEGYAKASRSFNQIWKERDSAQPNKDEGTRRLGLASWKQSPRILVHNTYSCHKHGNDKRKR